MLKPKFCAVVSLMIFVGCVASGAPITVTGMYNTGADLNNDGLDDNWDLGLGNAPITTGTYPWTIPSPTWAQNSAMSRWISATALYDDFYTPPPEPTGIQSIHDPGATYYYFSTSFTITGDPRSGYLNLWLWVDNVMVDILVNGVSAGLNQNPGNPGDDYTSWVFADYVNRHHFTIPGSLFQQGTNTLEFEVWNMDQDTDPNPVGMRAELAWVPEPSQYLMLGVGLAAIAGLKRRFSGARR